MPKWEYRSYMFEPHEDRTNILDKLGAEGWEAWWMERNSEGKNRIQFKRPIEEKT